MLISWQGLERNVGVRIGKHEGLNKLATAYGSYPFVATIEPSRCRPTGREISKYLDVLESMERVDVECKRGMCVSYDKM